MTDETGVQQLRLFIPLIDAIDGRRNIFEARSNH
jgi:hypothetical protein